MAIGIDTSFFFFVFFTFFNPRQRTRLFFLTFPKQQLTELRPAAGWAFFPPNQRHPPSALAHTWRWNNKMGLAIVQRRTGRADTCMCKSIIGCRCDEKEAHLTFFRSIHPIFPAFRPWIIGWCAARFFFFTKFFIRGFAAQLVRVLNPSGRPRRVYIIYIGIRVSVLTLLFDYLGI